MVAKKVTKTKETAKTEANTNAAAFDVAEMTETYRKLAEANLEKAQAGFENVKSASEEASKAMGQSFEVMKNDGTELSLKAIDAVRDSIATSFEHAEKLMGVKSLAEIIDLQSTYTRSQSENLMEQAKSFQSASQELTEKAAAPVKTVVEGSKKYFNAV